MMPVSAAKLKMTLTLKFVAAPSGRDFNASFWVLLANVLSSLENKAPQSPLTYPPDSEQPQKTTGHRFFAHRFGAFTVK